MAYTKPGVLITQVQETVSPALVAPDLYSAVVGRPHYFFKHGAVTISDLWNPVSGGLSVDIDALYKAQYPGISGLLDTGSIYVDLVGISGVQAGKRIHATFDSADPTTPGSADCWYAGSNLVVSGTDSPTTYTGSAFRVEAGFRVLRYDLQKAVTFAGGSDIQETIGPVTVFNELGTALTIATSNSNRVTYAYGTVGVTTTDSNSAQNALGVKDVYAYAPLLSTWSKLQDWKSFVEDQSLPTNKKESVAVVSPDIPWRDNNYGLNTTTNNTNTAADVAARAALTQARRLVMVHPDVAYIREKLQISQIKQAYLKTNIGESAAIYNNYGLYAKFTGTLVLSDGTKYFADDDITDTVWAALVADDIHELTVLIPVPGCYVAAGIAGQISGEAPAQPLTNIPVALIDRIKYSNDHFSNANLNSMAEGGVYIMTQDQTTLPIVSRHQLTTDTTSIEARELSIVKSVDFASKFLRRNLRAVIGRNNITDAFLKNLRLIINAAGISLVKKGVLRDMKLTELKQDTTQPDKVTGKVKVLALYPSNYIEIDLIY
jgi:hypothetical protein